MKQNERDQLSARLRRGAIAVVASGAAAAATVHASPSGNIVLAWPTDLPTLTRQTGEAMFLHNTIDGRTFVYIEPNQGARPAVIDLTDIARPKTKAPRDLTPLDRLSPLSYSEITQNLSGSGSAR